MSRETQYVGLTKEAEEFVREYCQPVILAYEHCTTGICGEKIPLGTWKLRKNNSLVLEVVQISHWSSGPMLFTCLLVNGHLMELGKWKGIRPRKPEEQKEHNREEGLCYLLYEE